MQAARGTPVDSGESQPEKSGAAGLVAAPRLWVLLISLALVVYAADQLTKRLAVEHLQAGEDKRLVGELLQLHLTHNPGAAFSMGTGMTVGLTCLAIVAIIVLLVVSRKVATIGWALALGFLLAGISGNLTDRFVREPGAFKGHVVDFLMLPHWPIFNVADIGITVGVALIVLQVLRGIGLDGKRLESSDPAEPAGVNGEEEPA